MTQDSEIVLAARFKQIAQDAREAVAIRRFEADRLEALGNVADALAKHYAACVAGNAQEAEAQATKAHAAWDAIDHGRPA